MLILISNGNYLIKCVFFEVRVNLVYMSVGVYGRWLPILYNIKFLLYSSCPKLRVVTAKQGIFFSVSSRQNIYVDFPERKFLKWKFT